MQIIYFCISLHFFVYYLRKSAFHLRKSARNKMLYQLLMTTYISLLRGINVSGQKIIKMEALRAEYEALGFADVKTYIQSGNVIFQAENENCLDLAQKIAKMILQKWEFEVPVMVKTVKEWQTVLQENPFILERNEDKNKLHVTFLAEVPDAEKWAKIEGGLYGADAYILAGKTVYLFCPNGYGNTKLTNTFFESKLKCLATTRNWNTLEKIATFY